MKLERNQAPRYYEAVRLSTRLRIAGWFAAVAAALLGVTTASLAKGSAAGVIGVALAAVGAVGIAGLVRCRVFEIVVDSRLLTVGTGPFRRRIPLGLITRSDTIPAGSWRRLYADRELALTLSADEAEVAVPTRDPEGLGDALRGVGQ